MFKCLDGSLSTADDGPWIVRLQRSVIRSDGVAGLLSRGLTTRRLVARSWLIVADALGITGYHRVVRV